MRKQTTPEPTTRETARQIADKFNHYLEEAQLVPLTEAIATALAAEADLQRWANRLAEDSVVAGEVETTGYTRLQEAEQQIASLTAALAQAQQELADERA